MKLPAPVDLVLRFFAIAVLLVITSILLAPQGGALSPYISALTDLAPDAALAAGCQSKTCQSVNGKIACAKSAETSNCKAGPGFCEAKPCIR
jgi:hypothetical protein